TAVFPDVPQVNNIADLIQCGNSSAFFNLGITRNSISSDPNHTINFFDTYADAVDNIDAFPDVISSTSREVFVRVTNDISGCFTITSFNLVVSAIPTASISTDSSQVCNLAEEVTLTITGTPGAHINYTVNGEAQSLIINDSGVSSFEYAITSNTIVELVNAQILDNNGVPSC